MKTYSSILLRAFRYFSLCSDSKWPSLNITGAITVLLGAVVPHFAPSKRCGNAGCSKPCFCDGSSSLIVFLFQWEFYSFQLLFFFHWCTETRCSVLSATCKGLFVWNK